MAVEWPSAERWLMGSASVDSLAGNHINMLCDTIGVRWGGSPAERRAAEYIRGQFDEFGLENTAIEDFDVNTWDSASSSISIVGESDRTIDVRASMFCPALDVTAPLVDVGFAMAHEVEPLGSRLDGAIALVAGAYRYKAGTAGRPGRRSGDHTVRSRRSADFPRPRWRLAR